MSKSASGTYTIKKDGYFSLPIIFDCGQAFRFSPVKRDGKTGFEGVAGGRFMRCTEDIEKAEILYSGGDGNDGEFFDRFFDTARDYGAARNDILLSVGENETVKNVTLEAMEVAKGIKILRQDPFETLVTFITSQNNNIPRIKGLIERLCKELGDEIETPFGEKAYSFPDAERILSVGEEGLSGMKFGFRAGYINACAKAVTEGFDLSSIEDMSDIDAKEKLMTLRGVGPKVADCVLLFGYGRLGRFPVDVWMKRAINELFGGTLPDFGKYAGLCQQYFFYRERYLGSKKK